MYFNQDFYSKLSIFLCNTKHNYALTKQKDKQSFESFLDNNRSIIAMALDRSQLIRLYVNRLVNSLVPEDFGQEYIQSLANELSAHLVSNDGSEQYNLNQIINRFKGFFLSNGMNEEWIRFNKILELLSELKSPEQICRYLVFLTTMKDNGLMENVSPKRASSQWSTRSYSSKFDYGIQSSPYKDARVLNTSNTQSTLESLISPYYETLPEETIMTYLTYTLLGLDSKLISFGPNDNVELPTTLNASFSSLMQDIIEPALLYRKLKSFLESSRGKLDSPIKTAFLTALDEQLSRYVDAINAIFAKGPQSLLFVLDEIQHWIIKLRLLHYLRGQLDQNGYLFLSDVYQLTRGGDTILQAMSQEIFNKIMRPYFETLEHWIVKGELIDNCDEFFISFNTESNDFNSIIEYKPSRLPYFISDNLGSKIFQIGKILIFLGKYCKELDWIQQHTLKYSNLIFYGNNTLKSMSINKISEVVNSKHKELLNYFTITIQGKIHSYEHLKYLKKYLLMESNDLVEVLIQKGAPIFNDSSSNLSSNYLSKILVESILNSSAKSDTFANRLDARVLDPTHGSIGWEVFTLEYKIDDIPLYSLIKPSLVQYLKMFNFFWRLRHIQSLLNSNYIDSCALRKVELKKVTKSYIEMKDKEMGLRNRKIKWLVKSFNTVNLIRNDLVKFMNSFVSYLSHDLVENNFQHLITDKLFKSNSPTAKQSLEVSDSFMKSLPKQLVGHKANISSHNMNDLTVDEFIAIHSDFLSSITNSKILDESIVGRTTGKSFISQIYSILDIVFNYIKSAEEFYQLITNYILILNIEENLHSSDEMEDDLETVEANLRSVFNKIYKHLYLKGFKPMLNDLHSDFRYELDMRDVGRLL